MSKNRTSTDFPPEQYPFRIKNWDKFQYYKFRRPPWIRLHISTLQSPDWVMLDDNGKLLMLSLMMLASQFDGHLPAVVTNPDYLKRVLHLDHKPNIKPLINLGFILEMHAPACNDMQSHSLASQSTESETEKKDKIPPADAGGSKYVFENGVIRITQKDMDRWRQTYQEIDVPAVLESLAEWAATLPKGKWFHAVKAVLTKRNQEARERRVAAGGMVGEMRV